MLSMRRFVIAFIPCYMLMGFLGKRTWLDRLIIGASLPLQAYFMVQFSHLHFAG